MKSHPKIAIALAATFVAVLAASGAQALTAPSRHGHAHVAQARPMTRHWRHHYGAHAGDIVVRTGRSYLDPGTSAEVGSENHYFSDTATYSQRDLGAPLTAATAGFELLPDRFNPPGRRESLFDFP